MKKISITLTLILLMQFLNAQNSFVKQWDKQFGGTLEESFTSFIQTNDGGYLLGGYSYSNIGGDKSQATWGGNDYWIVKIDSLGNKLWDKDFGGLNDEHFTCMKQTTDGGYILGGWSASGIGGDKTQPTWGIWDYWIIKIDVFGNKQWDKDFGGTDNDYLYSLSQTTDGGFILGGRSFSGGSGDKTQPVWGADDFWIVKTDSVGNKQWDKDFGGTDDDILFSLQQTNDGGYILGGISYSGVNGDKSQPTWGGQDFWIIKTDSLGSKQWDKDFGGTNMDALSSLEQTNDGGFILGGISSSGISGNKSQNNWDTTLNTWDYWIVKTDSLGNKLWDKDFGGTDMEWYFGNISQANDNGYLLCGFSSSNISGDKTENNTALSQTWIVKTDSIGIKQWDKTIFSNEVFQGNDPHWPRAIQTNDGCYATVITSDAGIGGYKSQAALNGTYDYWILKFCDTTSTTSVQEIIKANLMEVNPNPVTDKLNITINNKELSEIILYDIAARIIMRREFTNSVSLNTEQLAKGLYLYEVRSKDGSCKKGKVVKD